MCLAVGLFARQIEAAGVAHKEERALNGGPRGRQMVCRRSGAQMFIVLVASLQARRPINNGGSAVLSWGACKDASLSGTKSRSPLVRGSPVHVLSIQLCKEKNREPLIKGACPAKAQAILSSPLVLYRRGVGV